MSLSQNAVDRSSVAASNTEAESLLVLVPVGAEDWLIHDSRFPHDDARRLVACVRDRSGDHVDVIWLQHRDLPTRFVSLHDVVAAATAAVSASGTVRQAPLRTHVLFPHSVS
jgi:hypothetical protein